MFKALVVTLIVLILGAVTWIGIISVYNEVENLKTVQHLYKRDAAWADIHEPASKPVENKVVQNVVKNVHVHPTKIVKVYQERRVYQAVEPKVPVALAPPPTQATAPSTVAVETCGKLAETGRLAYLLHTTRNKPVVELVHEQVPPVSTSIMAAVLASSETTAVQRARESCLAHYASNQ